MQVLAPIRAKWISELRDLIAQARSRAHFYHVAESDGEADWKGERKVFHQEMTKLFHQIALMLDPRITKEKELLNLIGNITTGITDKQTELHFADIMNRMEILSREIIHAKLDNVAIELS